MPTPINPVRTRGIELEYNQQLRRIGAHVGHIISSFPPGPATVPFIQRTLTSYSEALTDWARVTASRMLSDVHRRDERAWLASTEGLSRQLREKGLAAPTEELLQRLVEEQVALVKSIPLEAGKRVERWIQAGAEGPERFNESVVAIRRSGEVAQNRATTIAITETTRAASLLTQTRAEHVGSTHFRWRTKQDSRVRRSHREVNGKIYAWGNPPALSDGTVTMPGQIYNCRCWAEPLLPEA